MLLQCSSKEQPPIAGGYLLLFYPIEKKQQKGFFWFCFPCLHSFLLQVLGEDALLQHYPAGQQHLTGQGLW